jgi:hypothetical protein
MVGDIKSGGQCPGGLNVAGFAWSVASRSSFVCQGEGAVPYLHGQTDDSMALLLQKPGGNRRVDPSAQPDGNRQFFGLMMHDGTIIIGFPLLCLLPVESRVQTLLECRLLMIETVF